MIERITKMLRAIGDRLRLLNEYLRTILVTHEVKGDAVDVNRAIVILWLNVITMFRTHIPGRTS